MQLNEIKSDCLLYVIVNNVFKLNFSLDISDISPCIGNLFHFRNVFIRISLYECTINYLISPLLIILIYCAEV